MEYEINQIYNITHTRKGSFTVQVTSESDEWVTGTIIEGKANAIIDCNVKHQGDEITMRKSLCRGDLLGKETKMRGKLSGEIKLKSEYYFDREMTTTELRLMPYIDYCLKNSGRIEDSKINNDDLNILKLWESQGYIDYSHGNISVTREFYDIIQDFLWLGYVDYTNKEGRT